MGQQTAIEWCDATFNPWWGCEKVSPACAHCYADTLSKRYAGGVQLWGDGHAFRFFGDKHWDEPLKWARTMPAKLGRRPRVFCASMADVFEERAELDEHRERLFDLIEATPELDWLLLTKRPAFARDWLYAHEPYMQTTPLPFITRDELPWGLPANVWMGVSIENTRYTWRADVLRDIPAAVRFISAEPLLGSLLPITPTVADWSDPTFVAPSRDRRKPLNLSGIDWVIAGGESGPKARPSHPDWFREIRDACVLARSEAWSSITGELLYHSAPSFFFKQWGEWAPGSLPMIFNGRRVGPNAPHVAVSPSKDAEWSSVMVRTGKKANGRELDGRTWDEFPASAAVRV